MIINIWFPVIGLEIFSCIKWLQYTIRKCQIIHMMACQNVNNEHHVVCVATCVRALASMSMHVLWELAELLGWHCITDSKNIKHKTVPKITENEKQYLTIISALLNNSALQLFQLYEYPMLRDCLHWRLASFPYNIHEL